MIQTAEMIVKLCEDDMKAVYEASQILRKAISQHIANNTQEFKGTLADTSVSETYTE